jgi:hypothetical protein
VSVFLGLFANEGNRLFLSTTGNYFKDASGGDSKMEARGRKQKASLL